MNHRFTAFSTTNTEASLLPSPQATEGHQQSAGTWSGLAALAADPLVEWLAGRGPSAPLGAPWGHPRSIKGGAQVELVPSFFAW